MEKINSNQKNKNTQAYRYQLTFNNPLDYNQTHNVIKKTLSEKFPTLKYFCMADEHGSCHHTHVFICFSSRLRFSTVKKHFPTAHIEKVKGTVTDNINYIKKSGKWENDVKHGTQIEGTFEEWGERPADSAGKNQDLAELYRMILDGMTNNEIISHNQDYIAMLDKLDKLRTMVLTEKYKGKRRLDMEVIYISGRTNTGKTRAILDAFGDENVYRVTDYEHPFDGYECQSVMVFDEFRSGLRLSDMLNYLDIYPIQLPARYANKYACYNKVFIISNWKLEDQYKDIQRENPESWRAFLRRIHKVRVYKFFQKFDEYDSVDAYMSRKTTFEIITDETKKKFHSMMKRIQAHVQLLLIKTK